MTTTTKNNRWRSTLIKPEAFNVRGANYAVTMTTDVGFLATGLTPIKEAFGMEFGTGNTFALPCAAGSPGGVPKASTIRSTGKGYSCNATAGKGSGKKAGFTAKNKGEAAAVVVPAADRGAPYKAGRAPNDLDQSPAANDISGDGDSSKVDQCKQSDRSFAITDERGIQSKVDMIG